MQSAFRKSTFMSFRGNMRRYLTGTALIVAVVLWYATALAASSIVTEVAFKGLVRTPEGAVTNNITTRVGAPLNLEQIDNDIRALYKLGQFQDVQVDSTAVPGGTRITYIFIEKPLISEIEFSGNRKIKADDLRAEVVQRAFSVLDEEDVAESMQKIREAYAKKGYYLAGVDYHLETQEEGEAKLIFDVRENQRVMVRRVQFIGNEVFDDDELRENIRTRRKGVFSFITNTGKYDEEMLRNDVLMLTYFYLNHGYLKVKVAPPRTTISKDRRYIFVTFQVHEGKQYRIGKVDISGDILTTREELMSELGTKPGDIYVQRTLDQDVMRLTDTYGDEGYAFASIVPRSVPNDEDLTVDIDFNVTKGKRVNIEKIIITGNTTTRDKVIRREMELMEDDRYSERLLRKSKENLMRLGYFEDVNFATPRGSRDDTMILKVEVKEKSTGSFNIGAGFSSAEHFIFNASVQKENFFGYGISGSISTELSKKRQLFMLSLTDPYFLDTKWIVGVSGYRSAYRYTDFRREATGGELNIGHRFFEYCTANIGYQFEQVKVGDFSYIVPQLFRQDASGITSAISLTLARDTRDNRITTSKGLYHLLGQEISGSKLGGDNDFYRVNFRSMVYQPIWKTITFRQFFRIGYIKSLNNKPVPLYERFFTGGVNSLRGYYPNSVGPKLRIPRTPSGRDEDFVYGGDKLMLFVTEVEFPIYDKAGVRGVVFFDAGNSFSENQNYNLLNLRLDYGFGVRWNSPMGPLRFEWGIPIERRPGEDSVVFNFTIGNFF